MKKQKVKILFAGDFCARFPERIEVSEKLKKIINSCNINFINFEGPLPLGELDVPNKTVLNQSLNSPEWCESLGFNVVSLANNHSLDYGPEGMVNTTKAFNNSAVIGVGNWEEAYNIKIITVGAIKIGFLAASSCDFSSLKDKWTDKNKVGCAWINSSEINKLIIQNRDHCDYLYVIPHGGLEYMNVPLPEWRDRYREIIDYGADGVIATHPHVPQGVEIYKNKPIFYSLGNFYFDTAAPRKKFWDNGLLGMITIVDDKVEISTLSTIRDGHSIDIDKSDSINNHLLELNSILKNDKEYLDCVNDSVLSFLPKYKSWLLSGFGAVEIKFTLKTFYKIVNILRLRKGGPNHKIAMHQIREESTRWAITRALKIKSNSHL